MSLYWFACLYVCSLGVAQKLSAPFNIIEVMETLAEISRGTIIVHLGQRILLALEDDAELELTATNALAFILAGQPFESAVVHLAATHPLRQTLSEFAERLQTFLNS